MSDRVQQASEEVARKTTRRGFFGKGLDLMFGALAGAAAGTAIGGRDASGLAPTVCAFPGPPCGCNGCFANGVCAKPCIIMTVYYVSGCWTSFNSKIGATATCCDCDCNARLPGSAIQICGCGSDYHNNPSYCPDGNASGPL
jgi:hypothetical protein